MMKHLLIYGALAVTGVSGFAAKSVLSGSPTESEPVQFKSATVSGNIIEQRMTNNPPTSQLSSKTVLKLKVNKSRVVFLNEVVTQQSSERITNELKALESKSNEPIYLLIDSPGGSVLDGTEVISQMEASTAPVYTVCTRLCASMAAMIHSYGTRRFAEDRAILMYHPASGAAEGQVPNMVSQLTTLTRYTDKMVANIVARSKVTKDEYNKLTAYELWIDSEDSLQKGLIDGIVQVNIPTHPARQQPLDLGGDKKTISVKITPSFQFNLIAPDSELGYWGY